MLTYPFIQATTIRRGCLLPAATAAAATAAEAIDNI